MRSAVKRKEEQGMEALGDLRRYPPHFQSGGGRKIFCSIWGCFRSGAKDDTSRFIQLATEFGDEEEIMWHYKIFN